MDSGVYCVLISYWLHLLLYGSVGFVEERYPAFRGFLDFRPVSSVQKYCSCNMSNSCSCCQSVTILYTQAEKKLCANLTYEVSGLNINATLNFDTLKNKTVTDYKPLKFCTKIPGCYFSSACVNVLELNKFPKSVTACLRLDILSKKRIWQLNYDCVSLSTELPMKPGNGTMNDTKEMGGMSTTMKTAMTSGKTISKTTMTTMMTKSAETEETTIPDDVEVITGLGNKPITIFDLY